jgi:hypothetical protein
LNDLKKLNSELKGIASLECIEEELSIRFEMDNLGHILCKINISKEVFSPDFNFEKHNFGFEIDQTYLPKIIFEIENILIKWPIKKPDEFFNNLK